MILHYVNRDYNNKEGKVLNRHKVLLLSHLGRFCVGMNWIESIGVQFIILRRRGPGFRMAPCIIETLALKWSHEFCLTPGMRALPFAL